MGRENDPLSKSHNHRALRAGQNPGRVGYGAGGFRLRWVVPRVSAGSYWRHYVRFWAWFRGSNGACFGDAQRRGEGPCEPATHQSPPRPTFRARRGRHLASSRKPGKAGPASGCNRGVRSPALPASPQKVPQRGEKSRLGYFREFPRWRAPWLIKGRAAYTVRYRSLIRIGTLMIRRALTEQHSGRW